MWSMCNEEPLQGTTEGARIFSAMMNEVHRWDTTRPISCAMNGGWGYGITTVEDLQGMNYNPTGYDAFHKKFPKMPFFGSETASAVSTRGEYVNDPVKGYVSAYDVNAPPWAQPAQVAWKALADRPFMEGGFVWTGFDYKGEPTPYGWPCINSHFGIMDMCGFPKDTYYYYKSWWGAKPVVHVFPHWNWKGKEGKPINVWVHSNCEQVELFLNGQSLGIKKMPRNEHLEWLVKYAPGSLVAKGYNKHKLIVTDRVETTGAPAKIVLKTDRTKLVADSEDVTMVEVQVLDAKGRVVPEADNQIKFSVSGAGSVGGVGNGDPSSHEPDKASQRSAFHGLCMVLVRATGAVGSIKLDASSPGLKGASLKFESFRPTVSDGQ
jgi:beta-galactosidase